MKYSNIHILSFLNASRLFRWLLIWMPLMNSGFVETALAYPPAPHHLFYGVVRDELGHPVQTDEARIIFTTAAGAKLTTALSPGLAPGINYRLEVPMDSGITAELYKPTALRPTVPFLLEVQVGPSVFLPIELSGDFSRMGMPGESTRLDLTLGEDADGDGLPDAWELQLIQSMDDLDSLADVHGGDDADGDGLSNLQEYLSGNYAYDEEDGFSLKLTSVTEDSPILEFMALRGRSYEVLGSNDLEHWVPLIFRMAEGDPEMMYDVYQSEEVTTLQIEIVPLEDEPIYRFFKLEVQ